MSLINQSIKNISLKELCILIILLYLLYQVLNTFLNIHFSSTAIYILIICYFLFKLRNSLSDFKKDFSAVFSIDILKSVILVVVLNIFFSYGMLYLSDFILKAVPSLNFLVEFHVSSLYLNNTLAFIGGFIASVLISPISEELIFRGVILNRLKESLPVVIAILMTSLLFAALHTYGSIISAFVFGMCMSILYLKTENIFVAIFAHFLNNLIAESIVVVDGQNLLFSDTILMFIVSLLAIISAILIIKSIIGELNKIK